MLRTLKSYLLLSVLLGIALFAINCDQPQSAYQTFLENQIAEHGLPGISAAIVKDGAIVFAGGAGYANLETKTPADENTIYRIASISKPIGAIGLMQLVEQEKVDIIDDISKYVPSFPAKKYPVLLKQILTHTSGIRHYKSGEMGQMTRYKSLEEAMEIFKDDPLLFEPGTDYSYTTYGFNLVQGIIESVSGIGIDEYMQMNVFIPAGMANTHFEYAEDIVPNRADGYRKVDGEIENAPYTDVSIKYIGGGMISNVLDLTKLFDALYTDKLMKPETRELMTKVHHTQSEKSGRALGWVVSSDDSGRMSVNHSGGATGHKSMLHYYPEYNVTIAVISNQDFMGVQTIAQKLADEYFSTIN